jgi:hypothetical protein
MGNREAEVEPSELQELARTGSLMGRVFFVRILEALFWRRRPFALVRELMHSGIPICSATGIYLQSRFSREHLEHGASGLCMTHLTLSLLHLVQAIAVLRGVERGMFRWDWIVTEENNPMAPPIYEFGLWRQCHGLNSAGEIFWCALNRSNSRSRRSSGLASNRWTILRD